MSSCTELTGSEAGTTSRNWMRATCVTGAKSASGSNGGFPKYGFTENTLSGASSHVYPSGGALATRSAPMFWLPPGLFSTTTGCDQVPCRSWAMARAIVSGEPPGVSGTMMRTGRSGNWASAASGRTAISAPASQRFTFPPRLLQRAVYLSDGPEYDALSQEIPMLTPEELAQLEGAESLFPSPIPVQYASSDEYMPPPQSAQQKEFEARIKEMGNQLAKKLGMTRRKFFKTAGGMAAAFVAMNEVYAKNGQPFYQVEKNEHRDLDIAQAR